MLFKKIKNKIILMKIFIKILTKLLMKIINGKNVDNINVKLNEKLKKINKRKIFLILKIFIKNFFENQS